MENLYHRFAVNILWFCVIMSYCCGAPVWDMHVKFVYWLNWCDSIANSDKHAIVSMTLCINIMKDNIILQQKMLGRTNMHAIVPFEYN